MATDTHIVDRLRQELKTWEKNFTADHGGRKPGRDDIKNNAAIKAKYRQYDRLCRPAPNPPSEPAATPKKASRMSDIPSQPLQTRPPNALASTPRKPSHSATIHPSALSPVQEEDQPTPAFIRSALGPTPQKDGHVLGIFDLLASGTPSKPSPSPTSAAAATIAATPSKPTPSRSSASVTSRSPQSPGTRFYLDAFAGTPLKRKRDPLDLGSPSTSSKKIDATPSFLRRSFPPAAPLFASRPPIRKSLSSLIRSMKQQENARMDDEWAVLNELEAEALGQPAAAAEVQVADSQAADLPLGPDQGAPPSEDEEAVFLGRDGLPRKAWKKKGLKRQTRRVNMKPVLHKPGKAVELGGAEGGEDGADEAVAETQLAPSKAGAGKERRVGGGGGEGGAEFGSDYGEDDEEEDGDEVPASPSKPTRKPPSEPAPLKEPSKPDKPDGILKKAAKKVAATANANYRRLNIKNKNSKAKGRGRFGGRR